MALMIKIICDPDSGYSFDEEILTLTVRWQLLDSDIKDPETGELKVLWEGTITCRQNLTAEGAFDLLKEKIKSQLDRAVREAAQNAKRVRALFGSWNPFEIAAGLEAEFSNVADNALAEELAS